MWTGCFVPLLLLKLTVAPSVARESELELCAQNTENQLIPRCELRMQNNNGSVQKDCLDGGQVLRIVGDYREFYIKCVSYFNLTFTYDGKLTCNAIGTKETTEQAKNAPLKYITRVRIRSVSKLKEIFKAKRADHPYVAQNSRTGRFQLTPTGRFRKFLKSFYIFFEEPGQKPELIKSKHTNHLSYDEGNVNTKVPCRSTHYGSMPTLVISQSNLFVTQTKTSGFEVSGLSNPENFRCLLQYNGRTDMLEWSETNETSAGGYEYFQPEDASAQNIKTLKYRLFRP